MDLPLVSVGRYNRSFSPSRVSPDSVQCGRLTDLALAIITFSLMNLNRN